MNDKTPFHTFSENTKNVCGLTAFTLLLLVASMSYPMPLRTLGLVKVITVFILLYVLVINFTETNSLVQNIPNIFDDEMLSEFRNNALLSYLLSFLLGVFVCFLIFTILF